jgi:CRISPR-associated protein Cmr3
MRFIELSNRELKKCGLDDEKEIFEFFSNEPKVLKLGGEMKNVSYEVRKNDFKEWIRNELKFPEKIELKKEDKILVLFLTYGVFDGEKLPQINDFEIYSACFGSYEIIGINSAKMGRKTKRAFAPGTVLWLESQIDATINNPSFLCKNQSQNDYYFNEPKGKQEFIGTNLVLIKKEGGHKNV